MKKRKTKFKAILSFLVAQASCLFVGTLAFTLALNGCVGGSNKLTTMKVAITHWPGFDIILYAQEAGLFAKRGLNVDLIRFENQLDSSRAVLQGSLDAAFITMTDAMQVDSGKNKPAFVLVTDISAGSDGIVAQKSIQSVNDLRGKKVGAKLGTVNHLILLEALAAAKIPPSAIEIVDVSNEIGYYEIKKGNLDATVIWEPLLSETAKAIDGNIIFTTKDLDSLVIDGVLTRSSFVKENKEELTKFILAWFDVMHAVETKPNEVFTVVSKQLGQTEESYASNYAGLKKGDIDLNRRMFKPQGRLEEAMEETVELLSKDQRHGRILRKVDINGEAVTAAMEAWKPLN